MRGIVMRRGRWFCSVVSLATAACGAGTSHDPATGGKNAAPVSSATADMQRPAPVDAAVECKGLGPLTVAVGTPKPAATGDGKAWIEHDLTLTNTSNTVVFVNDLRRGVFLGNPQALLVGFGGCGYGYDDQGGVSAACTADYRPFQIRPQESHVLTLTLWKDLPGMAPLRPGQFVLEQPVQYRRDRPFDDPRQTGSPGATIVVTYTVS